ncbi:UDP-N-acetylmuramoylalanine--D-glutamate ligase,UDP-N-acetylmuramoyl-L-alanyl-D-glutamate synthetase,UDP-N-acetylmuramoylalanine--D-glutamate ligase,Mur ligase middle domain [Chlamydia poikilotherma]|uniref:UDP-N-acetylmuramoylalanine--D-glutamate ligase n=1 Tax=Chlamydia poikilotherma TaxID=1967783 RepID=A0A3B0Q1B2_9CHLA|nr:UDP-N-acetylmuramoyl-L-alanine--D-glutamate ligase [Chlamydia poikilotherma]SYX09325.1 UDP-N-acetylmuramoylalanine--D-glutamate ligase,UDP-N-acetylmuramoyl-L-alanyl-D-glutamate synthetase,UDP-N-acetylmuramoylalanine--D-glutamate ligase,Mur ligase middle domain [Chlamydia poikilotherma]
MNNQRVIVLGAGITGRSVAEFLHDRGDYVIGMDGSLNALNSCSFFRKRYLDNIEEFPEDIDLFVRSPGIKPSHRLVTEAKRRKIPIVTDIQIAFQDSEFCQYPSIGITGSAGKTTTVLFLVHLLRSLGTNAFAMGNIGVPILQAMRQKGIRVVEISSFQLAEQEIETPVLSGAAILNVSDNHLDYHKTLQAYSEAKNNIAKCLQASNSLWVGEGVSSGKSYLDYTREIALILDKGSALKPLYLHDRNNYCAAYTLANEILSIPLEAFLKAIQTFEKPPHRIEYLGEKDGVRYINDSKATTMSSVEKALMAVKENVIVILGGRNKGSNFTSLIPVLTQTVKHIVAMGECRNQITQALSSSLPLTQARDLQEAVSIAQSIAQPGDVVLLSPGCASFDQFRSFEERGDCFKQLVGDMEALKI